MDTATLIQIAYIIAAMLFIFGLKMLSSPESARRGNAISALGMLIAVVVTLLGEGIITFEWIAIGFVIGAVIGALAARLVAMTQMPQMVALFNGFGGIASLLVGWSVYHQQPGNPLVTTISIALSALIGSLTFTGSIVAWGKLGGLISGKPLLYRGQRIVNGLVLIALLAAAVLFIAGPAEGYALFLALLVLALLLGVLSVLPIGGADMPVVISLLNSYSGLAACAAGFVITNNVLIVSGALVGASGIILTRIMSKAMNRSLANILFSGFGAVTESSNSEIEGEAKPITVGDAYLILEAAGSVVFVPGYGMAVAQAQHAVRELADQMEANGSEVRYAIHPVAGRMPGHMNVLLAEANVPYDQLLEPQDVNPIMETIDVAVVIGANDVVNPAARNDSSSPIYGMPVIEVDKAKTVFVLKRSLSPGFAGIDNPLFFADNTRMLFGDGKASVTALVSQFKQS